MNENQNLKPSNSSTKIFIFSILTAIFPLFVIPLLYFYNKNLKQQKEVETQLDKFKESFNNSIDLNKDTVQNINRIRSEQEVNSKKFNKEWNKWNTKTKIKRKPL